MVCTLFSYTSRGEEMKHRDMHYRDYASVIDVDVIKQRKVMIDWIKSIWKHWFGDDVQTEAPKTSQEIYS